MRDDLKIMHLMCAKICHDLSAPASAIVMGLDMLRDSPLDESLQDLVHQSAQSTLAKLELFRCLTGFAGIAERPTVEEVLGAFQRVWPADKIQIYNRLSTEGLAISGTSARLLLALLITLGDALYRGGQMTIYPDFRLEAQGEQGPLHTDIIEALQGKLTSSMVSVRTIIAYFAASLVTDLGAAIHVSNNECTEGHRERSRSVIEIDFVDLHE